MDGVSAAAILKVVASYGVLGLGWIAWILTMAYLQAERRRYQALVIHIIEFFTKTTFADPDHPAKSLFDEAKDSKSPHSQTFRKLFGGDK